MAAPARSVSARQLTGVRGLPDLALQHRELIPAEPCNQIACPRAALQAYRNLLKQQIPDRVAERVIDRLELVEIEIKDRERHGAPFGRRERLAKPLGESRAIGEPREPVGTGEQRDLLFRRLAFGDVDEDAFDFDESPFIIAHRDVAILHPV